MPASEAFSRVLIDQALTEGSWDLLNPLHVRFEQRAGGRADYVLLDERGMALCVLEAKREDKDPYDAKEQARGYAENLHAPFIILSNGRQHWFWNYERAGQRDAYRIERLPSPQDLARLRYKNLQPPRPLLTEPVTSAYLQAFRPDIRLHGYQVRAIQEIAQQFDQPGLRHGFYARRLEILPDELHAASQVEGLDGEIAALRLLARRLLDYYADLPEPRTGDDVRRPLELFSKASLHIAKLLLARHQLSASDLTAQPEWRALLASLPNSDEAS